MFNSLGSKLALVLGSTAVLTGAGMGAFSLSKSSPIDDSKIIGESVLVHKGKKSCMVLREGGSLNSSLLPLQEGSQVQNCLTDWSKKVPSSKDLLKIRGKEGLIKEISPSETTVDWIGNLAIDSLPQENKPTQLSSEKDSVQQEKIKKEYLQKNCKISKQKEWWWYNWVQIECRLDVTNN